MEVSRIVSPTGREAQPGSPARLRAADGSLLTVPTGWILLPPGDAALTRRVKVAGPCWQVIEKKSRKTFSHGLWAPADTIETIRQSLEAERADPRHARKQEAAARRREKAQDDYVQEFAVSVREYLRFASAFADLEAKLVDAVTGHSTPVGSGTVARTRRISVSERVEAAVIAWLRHQTTAYDQMKIPRVRGARRQVRRQLAQISRELLDRHRTNQPHPVSGCPLCTTLAALARQK